MVGSEYIEDVRSYEDLSKYKIMSRKIKGQGELYKEGSGDTFSGSGLESTDVAEIYDMDNDSSEISPGEGMSSSEDFIAIHDDDEGK